MKEVNDTYKCVHMDFNKSYGCTCNDMTKLDTIQTAAVCACGDECACGK